MRSKHSLPKRVLLLCMGSPQAKATDLPASADIMANLPTMHPDITTYHQTLSESDQAICTLLAATIVRELPEAEGKVWHGHPVWSIAGNPIVGYSRQKAGMRLMFWSGADFGEYDSRG